MIKKILLASSLLVALSFPAFAAPAGASCNAQQANIERQIQRAQANGNKHRVVALQRELSNLGVQCRVGKGNSIKDLLRGNKEQNVRPNHHQNVRPNHHQNGNFGKNNLTPSQRITAQKHTIKMLENDLKYARTIGNQKKMYNTALKLQYAQAQLKQMKRGIFN